VKTLWQYYPSDRTLVNFSLIFAAKVGTDQQVTSLAMNRAGMEADQILQSLSRNNTPSRTAVVSAPHKATDLLRNPRTDPSTDQRIASANVKPRPAPSDAQIASASTTTAPAGGHSPFWASFLERPILLFDTPYAPPHQKHSRPRAAHGHSW
jgi:hypothetical protein